MSVQDLLAKFKNPTGFAPENKSVSKNNVRNGDSAASVVVPNSSSQRTLRGAGISNFLTKIADPEKNGNSQHYRLPATMTSLPPLL